MWAYEVELRLHKPSVYSSNFQVLSLHFKFLSFKIDIEIYLGGWYTVYVFGFYGGKNKHLLQHFKQSLYSAEHKTGSHFTYQSNYI